MTTMTPQCSLSFAMFMTVVAVLQFGMTEGGFTPVKWSPSLSQQCGEHGSPELNAALTTVAEMIVNDKAPSSLPKSCTEIKESSPVSPSGFYTINDGSSNESGVVVYCDMDDLSSCPALEQTLTGFKKDVQQALSGLNEDVDSLEQTVSGVKEDVDSLNQTVGGIKEDVDSLFTHIESSFVSICPEKPRSCLEMKERCPLCESGIYEIAPDMNNVTFVYCAFEKYCNVNGPWMKVASWDISESGSSCPSGLHLFVNGTVSACGILGSGCQSIPQFISPVSYTQVCGRITGYQKGSDDAFSGYSGTGIDDPYVDGVSITRGSPRQHIWTFAIGVQENLLPSIGEDLIQCPCIPGSSQPTPSFVGNDYFCESGCPGYWDLTTFHAADPLWDGKGCGTLEEECCAAPSLPWFHRVLDTPTMDEIEIRVCVNQNSDDENVLISSYEIYVL